jgi:hypothetical protein
MAKRADDPRPGAPTPIGEPGSKRWGRVGNQSRPDRVNCGATFVRVSGRRGFIVLAECRVEDDADARRENIREWTWI